MTATTSAPTSPAEPTSTTWEAASSDLQKRFPGAKDSILFCVHALETDAEPDLDELKARASALGIRVTSASLAAARRLLDPSQPKPAPGTDRKAKRGRPARARAGELDFEALIRGVVEHIEQRRNIEADRLREGVRKAIRMLESAIQS